MTQDRPRSGRGRATALAFVALAALTVGEFKVTTLEMPAAPRATALCGLLLLKVGLVLGVCLRADFRRRSAARLVLLALVTAGIFAAVLMLEAAFQARIR